jgi:hypothetical protein
MTSRRTAGFRALFAALPEHVQRQAHAAYRRFRLDPWHPSLHFRRVHPTEPVFSVRIGIGYRAVGRREGDVIT